ncbi:MULTISPECIES: oligoendopeptidase F [unclassified Planococcus (in: firmicutes)]|uniref:oligoendopeptidase F n=1 Tax=unclassified Planococcus (in: firmicutes) TaxID=2662419 RepID=UPI000C34E5A9|nr:MULTISPECIES: oligoendopeptidase F [unclassified Planococcus (in: firmicutes)]AUD14264.1 oligoendopeptidase F [Planococcus sp. MB-3u-03]PKG48295.1 oligoendopeptidase F [Planococcus sp. Urea-trap-24]PKG92142.1 oligoendopeptidase F [Planococcus sp. Urea-3u-39]PKH42952.1 oligoendopeptidase F [Planococcus sp. MB-3u-09]
MTEKLMTRDQVPAELTWRLEDVFATDAQWEEEFKAVSALAEKAGQYEGTLSAGADALYEALNYKDELSERLRKLYAYAHMRYDQDTTNSTYQAMDSRIKSLFAKTAAGLSFMTPEILSLDEAELNRYVDEHDGLKLYRHALEELNTMRPHVLKAEQEALLAQLSEVVGASSETFGMLNNADLEFPEIENENGEKVQITHGNYIRFMESKDRRVREDAFKAVYATYGKFRNTFASTLSGNVKRDNVHASIRNYSSAREAALSDDHIPEAVYDQLVETVNNNLHLLQRYVALRKEVLGLDQVHMYDMYTPLVKEVKMEIPYDKATGMMLEGLNALGEEYVGIVKNGIDNRWVDVKENKGKRSGAYSSGAYGTNPYILMNWQDNVDNLFTLAHEFGHSVHSHYTRESQPFVYGDYSIFVAEVASTTNEALLNEHLVNTTEDEQERIYLLNHWLDGFRGTVFRQTMFAEFEHTIHQMDQNGEALTADRLTEVYYELNKKYFGEDMAVDEEIGLEWARIPHFYYNYYVFQYATGFSAATALSKKILEEGQPAVERYINEFLKAGSSDYPIEVLKKAGVDMTSSEPVEEACKVFGQKLEELEGLLLKK